MINLISRNKLVNCIENVKNAGDSYRPILDYSEASILVIFINIKVFIIAFFALILSCLLVSYISWKKIKGQTGDVCGATQQLSEILLYFFICLVISI